MPEADSGEILTNARQADAVRRALEYLRAAREAMAAGFAPDAVLTECEGAMDALGALSGRSVREDVTQEIFSRFCVGKCPPVPHPRVQALRGFFQNQKIIRGNDLKISFLVLVFVRNNDIMRN